MSIDKDTTSLDLPSSGNSSQRAKLSTISTNTLDPLNDEDLIEHVIDLEKQSKHLQWENYIFIDILTKFDPSALEGLDPLTEKKQDDDSGSILLSRRHSKARFSISKGSIADFTKGPRYKKSC